MICPVCKNQLADGSVFCGFCGSQLGASGAPLQEQAFEQPQQNSGYGTPEYLSEQAPSYGTPERNEASFQQFDQQPFEQPQQQFDQQPFEQQAEPFQAVPPQPQAQNQKYAGYNTPVNLSNQQPSYGAPQHSAENGSSSLALGIVIIAVVVVLIIVGIVLAIKGGKTIKEAIESEFASDKAYISVSIDNTN
ncbi:MAG: hypothetical protein IJH80_07805 [Ruminococcus sp.]|nr:hypothetical protein [Ruminococcus sp.]